MQTFQRRSTLGKRLTNFDMVNVSENVTFEKMPLLWQVMKDVIQRVCVNTQNSLFCFKTLSNQMIRTIIIDEDYHLKGSG